MNSISLFIFATRHDQSRWLSFFLQSLWERFGALPAIAAYKKSPKYIERPCNNKMAAWKWERAWEGAAQAGRDENSTAENNQQKK